jgi:hypothetical protein
LKKIWVDRIINRVLWNQFIGKLNDEWTGLALSVNRYQNTWSQRHLRLIPGNSYSQCQRGLSCNSICTGHR